jgi:hypothetical protein
MITFTSTLPDEVISKLNKLAETLKVPKNKIIEKALTRYMEQIERQMYIKSFKQITDDPELLNLAEEEMEDYESELKKWDEAR